MAIAPLLAAQQLRYGSVPAPFDASAGGPGGVPSDPVQIPLCWLSQPLTLRLERPLNAAEVTQLDGAVGRAANDTSVATHQVFLFTATLHTAVDADPSNLAHWTVTFNADPRTRAPLLVINLIHRSDEDRRLVLSVTRGRRIRLVDVPPEFPAGADHLLIAGVRHTAGQFTRLVEWTTAPVIGSTAGIAGPWFRWGSSVWSGADTRPF